jgi:phospholipid-binding lipoprotein MlaA
MKGRVLGVVSFVMAAALVSGADPALQASQASTEPVASPAIDTIPPSTETLPTTPLPSAPPSIVSEGGVSDEIVVTAKRRAIAADPLENLNETSFEIIQSVDKAFVGPVALAYRDKIPGPARSGIRNFLANIGEPIRFVNFVLQLKPGKALETAGRFTINTTIGVAGLIDVAKNKPFNMPRRVNGFAYTMGYYGIKSGPYLYLPLIGPTTLRDVTGRIMDLLLLPLAVGKPLNSPYYALPAGILSSLDDRAEFDEELTRLRTQSGDPYAALRAYYLNRRQAEIDALRGKTSPPPVPPVEPKPGP